MKPKELKLRPIQKKDNAEIAKIIREVMTEFGCVGHGYSIEDPEVDDMFENYNRPHHQYLVIEKDGKVIGGGGIGNLIGEDERICELKKMYFFPEARGHGMGRKMVETLLETARELGYKKCYLETVARMENANMLYSKTGFKKLTGPMGNTGHCSCDSQYLRDL